MTQKEAIAEIERLLDCAKKLQGPQTFVEFRPVPALEMALAALRPVSREQVEKVWRGEWREEIVKRCDWKGHKREYYQPNSCSKCHKPDTGEGKSKFCPNCGAPMTDEAVQMVMKRLEALHGET